MPAEFERIIRFWLDRGVDGFRIDVGHGMGKPLGLPDLEPDVLAPPEGAQLVARHDVRWDQDVVHDYHRGFRRIFDSYPGDRMAVGEMWVTDEDDRLANYVRPDELNLAFNFELVVASWGAESFRGAIESSLRAMSRVGAPCSWVLGNHDVDRPASRYGGGAIGVARARAAALVQLSLPGAVYLYNGDELGLTDVDLPDDALRDPVWERSGHTARGRDAARVPVPWSGTAPPYGFSTTPDTWLPMPDDWAAVTVEAGGRSGLDAVALPVGAAAAALVVRGQPGRAEWLDAPAGVLAYRRGDVVVLLNTGTEPALVPPGELLLGSGPLDPDGCVPVDTAVWVRG